MWWIVNFIGLFTSWFFTDLSAGSLFKSTICPMLIGIFLMALVVQLALALGPDNGRGGHGGDSSGGFSGGDGGSGGGDCGGFIKISTF